MIEKHIRHAESKNFFHKKRQAQTIFWFESLVQEKIRNYFFSDSTFLQRYNDAKNTISKNETSILNAVNSIFGKSFF